MYCSDDCQEKSWDYGHKEFCETRRSKLLASKHKKIIPSCRGNIFDFIYLHWKCKFRQIILKNSSVCVVV